MRNRINLESAVSSNGPREATKTEEPKKVKNMISVSRGSWKTVQNMIHVSRGDRKKVKKMISVSRGSRNK